MSNFFRKFNIIFFSHFLAIANQTRRSNEQWPDKSKPYLKFVLYKENRDTMDAIQSIAACLK